MTIAIARANGFLTDKASEALDYEDAIDRWVLRALAHAQTDFGQGAIFDPGPYDRAHVAACIRSLERQDYILATTSGYVLTPAGDSALGNHPMTEAEARRMHPAGMLRVVTPDDRLPRQVCAATRELQTGRHAVSQDGTVIPFGRAGA